MSLTESSRSEAVVELQVRLAVAGRAADVGEDHGDAQLVDQVVEPAQERGAELALGAAVDVDQDGPAGRELRAGLVDERGDLRGRRRSGSGPARARRTFEASSPPVSLAVQRSRRSEARSYE